MPVTDLRTSSKHTLCLCPAESNSLPPQLPPRTFTANDVKDSEPKSSEQLSTTLSDTFLMRLQHMDMSTYVHSYSIGTTAYPNLHELKTDFRDPREFVFKLNFITRAFEVILPNISAESQRIIKRLFKNTSEPHSAWISSKFKMVTLTSLG